jgi:fructokinase
MNKNYYLGIDVGGTKIEGAVALLQQSNHSLAVLSKRRINCIHHVEDFIESLAALIHSLVSDSGLAFSDLKAIGIGLPGTLDPKTNIMLNGNTQFLIGVDIIKKLRSKIPTDISIVSQNDANLFTLAEVWGGAGLRYEKENHLLFQEQVAVGITLGTGVGGGLVFNGKNLNGAFGSAMEVGHISLNPEGPECYCGSRGCAETYLSGTALNKIMDSKEIFNQSHDQSSQGHGILIEYRSHLLHFLSILNNLFNPHYFVFGGGLSSQVKLFNHLEEELKAKIFLSKQYAPKIYINELGDSAGLFGAMIYAHESLGEEVSLQTRKTLQDS